MSLKDYVLEKVKPEDYYTKRFPKWDARVRGNVKCCFHTDNSPSLSICLRNGGAHCHASSCAISIGNIVHFESELKGIPEKVAARKLYAEFVRPIVSLKLVLKYREALVSNGLMLLKIQREMGLRATMLKRFTIGYDEEKKRVTIPVYDEWGNCVNIRFYKLPSMRTATDEAKIYNLKGYGANDLFPAQAIADYKLKGPTFVTASEKEALICIQDGLQAVCGTSGEGAWNEEWADFFSDREVYTVMDLDKGGRDAVKRLLPKIATVAKSSSDILLPFSNKKKPDWKDLADWVLKDNNAPRKLLQYGQPNASSSTKSSGIRPRRVSSPADVVADKGIKQPKQSGHAPELPPIIREKMYDVVDIGTRAELLNCRIQTQGIVAARSPSTFTIPWKFRIKVKKRPAIDYEIPLGRELLRFVHASDASILQFLQTAMGSPNIDITPIEYITVTEVEIIPIAAVDRDIPYVVQRCYYFGKEIKDNVPYYLEVIPTTDVRSQQTVGIITKYIPVSKSIDRFDMTPALEADLTHCFTPEGRSENDVWAKLVGLADYVSEKHTLVYNRKDWHMVALLSWASPIGWRFPNEVEIQRGWINALVLGDTETGKSKVVKSLQTLFNNGIFVSSENCTYVGLVGGAIKMGSGQLMLRWGRIPLSDKQLVILEELSGLSVEEISNMSDLRSSGIAKLDKGGINSSTTARTRLICLSNVRSKSKILSDYLSGVKAIQELIGHGEDIARFDLMTTLVDSEVSVDTINTVRFATVAKNNPISVESFRNLIHFIWSLTPDQIEFSKAAYEECLEQTKSLSAIYHPAIPIFKGGSGRYKLGRIAASIACLQFAYADGKVRVTEAHVKAAVRLLKLIYNKPSFGYTAYSKQMYDRNKVDDAATVEKVFAERVPRLAVAKTLESLIHLTRFSQDEFMAVASVSMLYASQIIGYMLRSRIIRKGEGPVWEITPPGKVWMEKFALRYKPKRKTP